VPKVSYLVQRRLPIKIPRTGIRSVLYQLLFTVALSYMKKNYLWFIELFFAMCSARRAKVNAKDKEVLHPLEFSGYLILQKGPWEI
jgi:hypothetical protein